MYETATWLQKFSIIAPSYGFVHLRAASNRPLRATWAKTAATTLLSALLSYGR